MTTSIYQERLTAVRQKFDQWQIDGLYITSSTNRRWLSGFTGSAGQLLITGDKAIFSTDSRYWEQIKQQCPDYTLHQSRRQTQDIIDLFDEGGVTRLGLEASAVTLASWNQLRQIEGVTWKKLAQTIEPLRAIKSPAEIDAIRAAAALTDQAMQQVNQLARVGMTEQELAWQLEKFMRETGADGMAFGVIVASGPNSALPHHHPGKRPLQAGDALIVDMGAQLNGYNGDLTRSFHLGDQPDEKFWQVYNLVKQAHANAMAQTKAGMSSQAVDALAREIIYQAGYEDYFGHGLGHGIGLDVHEKPHLSYRESAANEIIALNMVLTIEPGVYIPGWGGVRIEDLALLTTNGLESISRCPQNPIIPG